MEELVVKISNRFINLAPEQMDNEISRTLDAVRDFSGADRCYLSLHSEDGTTIAHVFESCSEGIKSRLKELQRISLESFPWTVGKFRRGETIYISDIDDLPPEAAAEKELWTKSSVGAMAAIPVVSGRTLYGYFALNSQRKGREWMAQDMGLLSLVGEIFASTLERIRAEKERRKLEAEILEGQRREVETRQRENERWIALGRMASGIAHDIRNPINYVSLALDHISGKEQTGRAKGHRTQKLIENAHSELMRVNEMIKGLLEYGRTQSLNLQTENASAILADSVREVILHHPGEESRIRLEGVEGSFPIFVQGDLLQRALTNLVENALETGEPQVEVRTGVSYDPEKKDKVVLWIRDTGPGIPEANLGKIFIPFFTTKKSGIGLGLTLVQTWVREMGGEIKASNVPEGGARFEILFPAQGSRLESRG